MWHCYDFLKCVMHFKKIFVFCFKWISKSQPTRVFEDWWWWGVGMYGFWVSWKGFCSWDWSLNRTWGLKHTRLPSLGPSSNWKWHKTKSNCWNMSLCNSDWLLPALLIWIKTATTGKMEEKKVRRRRKKKKKLYEAVWQNTSDTNSKFTTYFSENRTTKLDIHSGRKVCFKWITKIWNTNVLVIKMVPSPKKRT